jgi:hypothetical protein
VSREISSLYVYYGRASGMAEQFLAEVHTTMTQIQQMSSQTEKKTRKWAVGLFDCYKYKDIKVCVREIAD